LLAGSPCIGVERTAPEQPRERCLTDDEVRVFWAATGTLPAPIGDAFRLLLLSAGRVREVSDMRWAELDLARCIWTLPASRNKAKVDLERPLGALAWEIIAAQPRRSEYVFGRLQLDYMKRQLDRTMHVTDWRMHDLRRVARSLLARARVQSDTAEMCLGHLLTGQRKIYDKHGYVEEKRAAYEALEREIDLIVNPPDAAVIPFRR
jgi:integrase